MPNKVIVIYHGGCFDGVAAAWCVRKALQIVDPHVDIEFHAASYGQPSPDTRGKIVYIVDFSYPRDMMESIIDSAQSVTVLDHHQSALAALGNLDGYKGATVVFDMKRSGAGIAWDHMLPQHPRPIAIDLIEDRDLWNFAYPDTKAFIAGIATGDLTMDEFDKAVRVPYDYVKKGRAVLDYIETFGKKACEHVQWKELAGYQVPLLNVPYMNSSDHVDTLITLLLKEGKDFKFAGYFFLNKFDQWQFGLRSRGEFDVSEVAKLYGGGGHKNASGFSVKYLPWDLPQSPR